MCSISKYKFTLAPKLKDFIEWQLKYYPENKRQLATKKESLLPSQISQYGPRTGGSFDSEQRPTEDVAVKLNSDYITEQERIISAIESVLNRLNDQDKEMVRLMYWSGELTPDGIALKLAIDRATMYYRLNNILVEIARRLGLVEI